jgi:hypothetical protein
MGGSPATGDTLVGDAKDTTDAFNLYDGSNLPRPGDPCFEVYTVDISAGVSTLDSLKAELWVTDRASLAKDANGWMYVTTYSLFSYGNFDGDGVVDADEDMLIVADTLEYIPCRYARIILFASNNDGAVAGGSADDSLQYLIYFVGDKSKRND